MTASSIAWAFRATDYANWFPLTWLSHMLDCQLFKLNPAGHPPSIIMLVGLQGSGKTTTAAKLARLLKEDKRRPGLVAADLKRHLNHEPVTARPPTAAYKIQKFVRRNKVMVGAVGAVAVEEAEVAEAEDSAACTSAVASAAGGAAAAADRAWGSWEPAAAAAPRRSC